MKHRCRECTLLRVDHEGAVCEECLANMPPPPAYEVTFCQPVTEETTFTLNWPYGGVLQSCGSYVALVDKGPDPNCRIYSDAEIKVGVA